MVQGFGVQGAREHRRHNPQLSSTRTNQAGGNQTPAAASPLNPEPCSLAT
jgi:hypothetical protein